MRRRKFERVERIEPGERGPRGDDGPKGEKGDTSIVFDESRERDRDRVVDAAERKRDRKAFKDAAALLAIPVSIVMVAALLGMGYGIVLLIDNKVEERERTTYAICQAQKVNRDAIRNAILQQTDPTKLKPGEYGYAYAQANWDEALQRSRQVKAGKNAGLRFFPKIVCVPPGGKPTTMKETP
jgi:hypothetical protein